MAGSRPVEGSLSIIFKEGAGPVLSPPHFIQVGPAPREVTLVDIDEDGDLDVACIVGPPAGGFIRIIENTTTDLAPQHARLVLHRALDIPTLSPPAHLLAFDVDGDGDNELVSLNNTVTVRTVIDANIESHQNLAINSNPADLNGDGVVDGADLAALLAAWGLCAMPVPPGCPADFNDDGVIDGADLAQLLASWT
jgi:hypothetical protein